MRDAKFESGSFSIVGDTTSQIFPLKKGGNKSSNSDDYPRKMGSTLENINFYFNNHFLNRN